MGDFLSNDIDCSGVASLEADSNFHALTISSAKKLTGLENSAPFKLHKRSDYPPLTKIVNSIDKQVVWPSKNYKSETTFNNYKKKRRNNLRSLVIDLYAKHVEDPQQYTTLSRNKNDYSSIECINKAGVTYQVVECADVLEKNGYIDMAKGFHTEALSRQTRIRATDKLIKFIENGKGTNVDFFLSIESLADPIRLKDENKKYISYEDNEYTIRCRDVLIKYNRMMARHAVSHENVYEDYSPLVKTDLHRIFNNSSWTSGGRYAGASYQYMKKHLRPSLLIDGKKTIELDFSAAFPTLAYNLQGCDYWGEKQGVAKGNSDPYVFGSTDVLNDEKYRKLNKKIFNTYLMIKGSDITVEGALEKTRKVVQSELNSCKNSEKRNTYPEIFYREKKLDDGYSLSMHIKEFMSNSGPHATLDLDKINGMFLMHLESEIATEVMSESCTYGVPLLLVHDSFIVEEGEKDFLSTVMESSWNNVVKRHSSDKSKNYKCKWK